MAIFTRHEIEDGLKRLGELAQARGFHTQLTLVGGAVMVLQFNARPSTRDIDAVILEPREAVWCGNWLSGFQKNSSGQKTG
jgi:hypothetical protein